MSKYYQLAFLFCLILLSNCGKDDSANILINIEKDFNTKLIELLVPEENPLIVNFQTLEKLECSNYLIEHHHSVDGDKIIISIDGVFIAEDCVEDSSFIESRVNLGVLDNGNYDIEFNLSQNSIKNSGTLTIDEDSYLLEMESDHGFRFDNSKLHKIPDHYFWGTATVSSSINPQILVDLFNDFATIADPANLEEGNYGAFEVSNSGIQIEDTDTVNINPDIVSFVYELTGSRDAMIEIIENYQINHGDDLNFTIYFGDGSVY